MRRHGISYGGGNGLPKIPDCVYNDAFAWIMSRKSLVASTRGIYSVLNKGGKFIFQGAHQWSEESDKRKRYLKSQ